MINPKTSDQTLLSLIAKHTTTAALVVIMMVVLATSHAVEARTVFSQMTGEQRAAVFETMIKSSRRGVGTIRYRGVRINCSSANIFLSKKMPMVGLAIRPAKAIFINAALMDKFPPYYAQFVASHECGHLKFARFNERDADRYAVQQGVREGWLNEKRLARFCDEFVSLTRASPWHGSPQSRCKTMEREMAQVEIRRERAAANRAKRADN